MRNQYQIILMILLCHFSFSEALANECESFTDPKAIALCQKAQQGSADDQVLLGLMYEEGDGITQSFPAALKWYKKAEKQGNARAQTNLGYMYEKGRGVTQSNQQAFSWYQKAAKQGEVWGIINLASMYHYGHGVEKNTVLAYAWYTEAAKQRPQTVAYSLRQLENDMSAEELAKARAMNK